MSRKPSSQPEEPTLRPPRGPAPGMPLRTIPTRLRASVLAKIVSPLVVALALGSIVTAVFSEMSAAPNPTRLTALDLLLVGAILLSAAVALSWLTVRAVTRPLVTLSRTARQVAAGNLDAHFSHASTDEIGQLASALETMKLELRSQLELIGSQTHALREGSKRITSARDEERRLLARDMHDGLQQQLVMLRMSLGLAAERVRRDPELAKETFSELGAELDRVIERVREVSHGIYPSILRDRGLTSAVRSQAGRMPITTRLTSDPDPLPRLAREIESSAYFILSEAVANVLKHSGATEIAVALKIEDEKLALTVSDNGRGFQPEIESSSRGLTHMDDRIRSLGGELFITSGAAGTVIRASLPLDPGRALPPGRHAGESPPGIEQLLVETATAGAFVGRELEIDQLRAAFEKAAAGRGRLVLLVGEAGIGKTRTANELATYASSRGADVLVGRCYEGGGAPAYWPWIQVLRSYIRGRVPEEVTAVLGPGAADIAQIVPELAQQPPEAGKGFSVDPQQARFRLFDSITSFLKEASGKRPLLIVLDDLQSADMPSLLLLEFLASELGSARLVIVATHRGVGKTHPLRQTLSDLEMSHLSETITLTGLRESDVARFMEATTGAKPPEQLLAAVYRQTEGNPLFVREVVRLLASEGRLEVEEEMGSWELDIPVTVREAIGRRLERLSPGGKEVLSVASAIGREFTLPVLRSVAGMPANRLSVALEEAVAARILVDLPGVPGAYRFNHALMRDTIYGGLGPRRRRGLHRHIAEVLEAAYGRDREAHLAGLAHHYLAAGGGRSRTKAIHYASGAGRRAASLLAFEEASGHYERALTALGAGRAAKSSEPRRCDLLLALGGALWRAGDTPRARETFGQAADIARRLRDPNRLARAAVGYGEGLGAFEFAEGADDVLVSLLEEALDALESWRPLPPARRRRGEQPTPGPAEVTTARLRVRVLARLAVELYYTDQVERRAALGQDAVGIADRLGHPATQLIALYSRFRSVLGPDASEERLAAAEEIVRLAEEIGDREMQFRGLHFRLLTLLERGDRAAVDAGLDSWAGLADDLRQPLYRWQVLSFRTMMALLEGRFDDSEAFMREALPIGRRGPGQAATIRFGAQRFVHHWGLGRLEQMEPAARQIAGHYPWLPGWQTGLAVIYTELDRAAEARAQLEKLAGADFADLPRDGNWLGSIAMASIVCSYLRDFPRAGTLFELLAPYEQRCIVVHAGGFCMGSAATYCGILAATLGRFDEAQRLFEEGLKRNEALGARPMTVLTLTQHAAMLTSRNGPGDAAAASDLLARGLELAQALDMRRSTEVILGLQRRAESLAQVAT